MTAATPFVYDVTEAAFEAQVVKKSFEVPVLVDFWAPWCGPCKQLGPALERLATEMNGAFVVAKLNTEEAPQLAAYFQIRSIPHCKLVREGRIVDEFTGNLPEGQLRQFLERHLVSEVEQMRRAAAEMQGPEKEQLLREAQALEPTNAAVCMDLADLLMEQENFDDVEALLGLVPEASRDDRYRALAGRVAFARQPKPQGNMDELVARVQANAKDFDARFLLSELLFHEGRYEEGFEQLLEVVLRDRGADAGSFREQARVKMIDLFGLCPDPKAVGQARRMLGMYLN